MTDFQQGMLATLGIIGGIVVTGGLIWLALVMIPEGIWWTVKRLPLASEYQRDRAAAVVASSRRAYVLRIPFGVRLVVSLGGGLGDQGAWLAALGRARRDIAAKRAGAEVAGLIQGVIDAHVDRYHPGRPCPVDENDHCTYTAGARSRQ